MDIIEEHTGTENNSKMSHVLWGYFYPCRKEICYNVSVICFVKSCFLLGKVFLHTASLYNIEL